MEKTVGIFSAGIGTKDRISGACTGRGVRIAGDKIAESRQVGQEMG